MKNILHINSNYLFSRVHENLLDHIDSTNFRHTIFMPMKEELVDEITIDSGKSKHRIYAPLAFEDRDKFIFTLKQKKIWASLHKELIPEEYSLTHAHTLFTDGNVAYELYKKYGIPYVVTVRGHTDFDFFTRRPNLRAKGRKILRHAEAVVFLSEGDRNRLFSEFLSQKDKVDRKKTVVMPNGIDQLWFQREGRPKTIADAKKPKFIFVGRMMKVKNLPMVVESLNELQKEHEIEPSLTIVGPETDPSIKDELERKRQFSINYLGKRSKDEIIQLYREHDIYIMPSTRETFGLVYAEAMSQGMPVIYSKNSGFYKQFKEGEIGYGVDPSDKQEIVSNILNTLDSYEALSFNALKGYKKFNWNTIGKYYSKVYEAVSRQ